MATLPAMLYQEAIKGGRSPFLSEEEFQVQFLITYLFKKRGGSDSNSQTRLLDVTARKHPEQTSVMA